MNEYTFTPEKLLIPDVRIMDPKTGRDEQGDILIEGGQIAAMGRNISAADAQILSHDAPLVAAPGLVDTHSHFRDPGFPAKETIVTGSRAAAKGGYTTILMMANTKPPIDSVEVLREVLAKASRAPIHVCSAANVTIGMKGDARTDFAGLAAAGARVFTDDGIPITDEYLLRDAMKLARKLHIPISLHEEDPAFVKNPGIHAGSRAARALSLEGASREAEIRLVKRDLELAVETGCALCIQHISAKESVELVREAKKKNPLIRAEATPHHFSLTDEIVLEKGTLAKVNPPIRTKEDRDAIIEGLRDKTIEIIATDHAPHTAQEKAQEFTKAPSGMIGLETALSLGIENLVRPGHLSLMELLGAMTWNPASWYGFDAGYLAEGGPADLLLFSPEETWTVTERFASKACNSPFIGRILPGKVHTVIASGRIVFADEGGTWRFLTEDGGIETIEA